MRGHLPRKLLALALLLVPGAAAAQIGPGHSGGRGATSPAVITTTSRPVRLLRTWVEPVKTASGDGGRRVEVMVDYANGTAWEKFTSLSGAPLGTMPLGIAAPRPSPQEIDEAFDFTRQLPELAPTFRRFPNLVLEGGFILREPQGSPCGPKTRCLHVFLLSPDRAGLIRRIVVDVAHMSLAYQSYVPPSGRFE